jgi:ankyrin repeat protein
LLAAGADVNEKVRGDYPLNVAATFGPVEIVTLLLDAGAAIEQQGRDGLQPLHKAVFAGRPEIVALLIQKGAAVEARDGRGRSPLVFFAASAGSDIAIARMLLAAGADPKSEDKLNGETALHYAAQTGDVELAALLIAAGAEVDQRSANGDGAIQMAVFRLDYEFVKLLIAAGADVNQVSDRGATPLSQQPNDPAMRKLLIDAGAK